MEGALPSRRPRRGRDALATTGETPALRIAFANTDLSGNMDHRSSILEADRALGQLLDQVLRA